MGERSVFLWPGASNQNQVNVVDSSDAGPAEIRHDLLE